MVLIVLALAILAGVHAAYHPLAAYREAPAPGRLSATVDLLRVVAGGAHGAG